MSRLLLLVAFFALGNANLALAQYAPEKLSDPKLEARAVALQRSLRCLVCQGESLDDSTAPLADDLRRLIRARIAAGQSDRQVTDYLVSRYGNVILMKPPLESDTYLLWFGPLLIFLAGGAVVAGVVGRAHARATVDRQGDP